MIPIGSPFITFLIQNNLTIQQYVVLYCYAYNKLDALNKYDEKFKIDWTQVQGLLRSGYLALIDDCDFEECRFGNLKNTRKNKIFIKSLVDSFDDAKSELILSEEDDVDTIAQDAYEQDFDIFYNTYPRKVLRHNGKEAYLRENKKLSKDEYIKILRSGRISTVDLQRSLEHYIDSKTKRGDMCWIKTMLNFLRQEIWSDMIDDINNNEPDNTINYGGKMV